MHSGCSLSETMKGEPCALHAATISRFFNLYTPVVRGGRKPFFAFFAVWKGNCRKKMGSSQK